MSKFSVIIPTIQKKLEVLNTLLGLLLQDTAVGEIIVINNKPEAPLVINNSDKIRVILPAENLYVNPSWNLGISEIQNENFALLNDDMLVCSGFLSAVLTSDIFHDGQTGLLGADVHDIRQFYDTDYIEIPEPYAEQPVFTPLKRHFHTQDWGIAILGKKKNYYTIPEDLKIIYGDNYLLYKNLQNGKINYQISGMPFNHIHSSSSQDKRFSLIVRDDLKNYRKYFNGTVQKQETNSVYKLNFKNDVCFLEYELNGKKNTICFKYIDDKIRLRMRLAGMIPKFDTEMLSKIVEEVISRNKAG